MVNGWLAPCQALPPTHDIERAQQAQISRSQSRYFFRTEGHGAPHGAQAPAKSSGETGRPADGEVR